MAQPQDAEVPRLPVRPPVEDFDVSQRTDVAKLRKGAIGLGGVLFLTVTGSAPISAMLFNTPIVVGFGQGVGAPAAFMFATIVLVVFSVGYVAMARKKTTAGGFYSYISHGLGRELGIGTGYASVVAYSVFEASLAGGFAYFLSLKLNQFGVSIAWPWLALAMVLIISILTYFDVRISSMVLAVGLISEVVILLIFDVFLLARGHVTAAPLNPVNAFKGFPAQGTLAPARSASACSSPSGPGSASRWRRTTARNPATPSGSCPRALYISVIGLGIFYTITSWASLAGYPTTRAAIAQSQHNAAQYFLTPAGHYAGQWVASVMSYLIITGSFACGMAFHNTTARYLYSVGREGLAPRALGKTHPQVEEPAHRVRHPVGRGRHHHRLFAIFTGSNDPNSQAYIQLYGLMAVMGVIIILSVQAVVSLAVLVYFERFHRDEAHWWRTRLAPLLAFISQAYVVYLLFTNIDFLGAGAYPYANWLGPIDAVVVLVGVGTAFYFKKYKPAKYEQAGRLINEGL
jgi:Amino acid transporters